MNDRNHPDPADAWSPEREAELHAATVGAPTVLNRTIPLAPYNPHWPIQFAAIAASIHQVLGARALSLDHAGSTSVPGLSAKPVIDMVLTVADSGDEERYVPPLETIGYSLCVREPDWYGHRLLRPRDGSANLHVFSSGCPEVAQMLRFRDRLRSSEKDRLLYESAKRELAGRVWKYMQQYADAKSGVIRQILASEPDSPSTG